MKEAVRLKIDELVSNISNLKTAEGKAANDRLLAEAMALTVTPEEKKEAGAYLREAMAKRKRPDIEAKPLLGNACDALSLSYIAKKYFGKDRTWLYQRLNGTLVNGKPATFTQKELTILADSLKDLSSQLSEISSTIHRNL